MIACGTMNGILLRDRSWMIPLTERITKHITTPTSIQFIWTEVGGKIREVIGRYIK
jgi:hypothetical protein